MPLTFNARDTTPQKIVLGLWVQEADSVAGVGRRMSELFPSARFANNAVHTNLPILIKRGHVRLTRTDPLGHTSLDCYEATPAGRMAHAKWLRTSDLPFRLRDMLQCKLEFLELDDLAGFVRFVRSLEKEITDLCDEAQARVLREQRSRRRRESEGKRLDWRARLRIIKSKDDATLLSLLSQRLERLGEELEELLADCKSAGEC